MPPSTKALSKLPSSPAVQIVQLDAGEEQILRMFSASGAGFALAEKEWSINAEFRILIDIARDPGAKHSDRIAAIRQLATRSREAAELSGLITSKTVRVTGQDALGNPIEATQSQTSLLSHMLKGIPNDKHTNDPFSGRTISPLDPPLSTNPVHPRELGEDNKSDESVGISGQDGVCLPLLSSGHGPSQS